MSGSPEEARYLAPADFVRQQPGYYTSIEPQAHALRDLAHLLDDIESEFVYISEGNVGHISDDGLARIKALLDRLRGAS